MLEALNILPKGSVKIFAVDATGNRQLLLEKDNSLQLDWQRILCNNMAAVPGSYIDTMEVGNIVASVFTALATINTVTPTVNAPGGGPYKIEFQGLFDEPSFSGSFAAVNLASASLGVFSQLIIPSPLTKTITERILIVWTITIN